MAMLSHPNIVSVYDVSTSPEADYIVMELVDGISLKQYMEKKGVLNWKETLHFSMQIAKALDHAHSRGIVHRDIKPHNIMILKDGSIKVADFGIARVGSAQNTLTREALGSVHYISPEQAKGARVDNRSDIYSLGVVMYEMLTGRTPYDGETPVSVAIQHINGGARRPSEVMPGIPLGLEYITMRAMNSNPEKRYATAAEMLSDMEEFRKNPALTFLPSVDAAAAAAATAQKPQQAQQRQPMSRTEAERYAAARAAKNGGVKTPEERRAERARREAEQAAERRKKLSIIAAISAAIVLVVLAIVLVSALSGGSDEPVDASTESTTEEIVRVDNFVGMKLEDIDPDDYPNLDVDVRYVTEEYSDEYDAGYVMAQDPKAGEEVKTGRTIKLTVSKGEEEILMPDLVNTSEADAMKQLEALKLGLKIKLKDESSEDVRQGNIVRTEPKADEPLEKNQEVVLYVSLGENKMPNLIGDTEDNAKARLKALNISVSIEYLYDVNDKYEEGRVYRTDPQAGDQLEPGDKIFIYVSEGDGKVPVPNVLVTSLEDAQKALKDAGLVPLLNEVYDAEVPVGFVVSQSEVPGTKVEKGTYVTIDISKGPDPALTEPPSESTTESTEALTEGTPSESKP